MWELSDEWNEILKDEFDKEYFIKLKKCIEEQYNTKKIYPKKEDIFNALNLTNYPDVKVIILGQDPYPGTDKNGNRHSMGLSFSSRSIYEIPRSLQNIYKELENDINGFKYPNHANLTKWAEQGVLLLNTILTVEAGQSNSHKGIGWEQFTTKIIETLGNNENPMVIMLFGNQAKKYAKYFTKKNKLVLEGAHPSPMSASKGFFGGKYFSQANDFLIKNELSPIDWNL